MKSGQEMMIEAALKFLLPQETLDQIRQWGSDGTLGRIVNFADDAQAIKKELGILSCQVGRLCALLDGSDAIANRSDFEPRADPGCNLLSRTTGLVEAPPPANGTALRSGASGGTGGAPGDGHRIPVQSNGEDRAHDPVKGTKGIKGEFRS